MKQYAPHILPTLVSCLAVGLIFHVANGDPWSEFPIRLAFTCAIAALVVFVWRRLARPSSPRSTGEVYDPKDESDLPGWETKP